VTDSTTQHNLFAPRHWPSWIGIGLLRLAWLLPYRPRMALGRALGRLVLRLASRRARIARINLELCFPELDPQAQQLLLKQHFESLGMGLMETLMAWWDDGKSLSQRVEFHGLEELQKRLDAGQGVILLTAHFTTLEIGARFLMRYFPKPYCVYRPNQNPIIDQQIINGCTGQGAVMIARDNVREMIRQLRKGRLLWYAPDQNYGHKYSLFVDFFGIPAATNSATSRLAQMGQAQVVAYYCRRKPDLSGYQIRFEPIPEIPSGDPFEDTTRINQTFERWARESPADYFWLHRRFKDRPEGEERFY
jgi:KDO2-lipid IV(A) lauroyltransferase